MPNIRVYSISIYSILIIQTIAGLFQIQVLVHCTKLFNYCCQLLIRCAVYTRITRVNLIHAKFTRSSAGLTRPKKSADDRPTIGRRDRGLFLRSFCALSAPISGTWAKNTRNDAGHRARSAEIRCIYCRKNHGREADHPSSANSVSTRLPSSRYRLAMSSADMSCSLVVLVLTVISCWSVIP